MKQDLLLEQLRAQFGQRFGLLQIIGSVADKRGVEAAIVGGSVRDIFLGRESPDIDCLVTGRGISFGRMLARRLHAPFQIFPPFDSAKIKLRDGLILDVAGARMERYHGAGDHPEVIGPAGIEEDMKRRDFSLNAMALIVNEPRMGEIIDPFGGQEDIKARQIRILHPQSFRDDPTRILRAYRLASRLDFSLEPRTSELAQEAVPLLAELRPGRWLKELKAAFSEERAELVLLELERIGALAALHPRIEVPDEEAIRAARQEGHKIIAALVRDRRGRKELAERLNVSQIERSQRQFIGRRR